MNPIEDIKNIVKTGIENALFKKRSGEILKTSMGLDKFKYIWIQKIIDISIPVFIVSYDSRYPFIYVPRSRLKKAHTMTINKVRSLPNLFVFKNFKLSPPVDLDYFEGKIGSNSIVITQDLCGINFQNKGMFESKEITINENKIKIL